MTQMALPDSLSGSFAAWWPAAQILALAATTLIQEDVPTITAAVSATAGRLSWAVGFWGCFLGIWLGDALLYLLARGLGRPALSGRWVRRFVSVAAVQRSEQWFAKKGTWLLISSRFVPGTRLPTYLAAGFLHLPFVRFLTITGVTVAFWTAGLFALVRWFGSSSSVFSAVGMPFRWTSIVGLALLFVALRWLPRAFAHPRMLSARVSLLRWTHWEFWPAWLFYLPVVARYLQLAFKHRSLTLPTATNPGIPTGGFVGESKFLTLQDLQSSSPEFTAETWFLPAGPVETRTRLIRQFAAERAVDYPFILKPDVGQRGVGVKVMHGPDDLRRYLNQTTAPLVMQRFIPGPGELGVFYYRFPGASHGHIFAITEKIFPTIVGDGERTVEQLVWQEPRARFMAHTYLRRLSDRRNDVLPRGTTVRLVEAGNHAQGCIFRDGARFNTPALAASIDAVSQRLNGFFIGRYDLRFATEAEVLAGRGFKILELNGAAAEATSIYDAKNSLRTAYQTLFQQWGLVFAIGARQRDQGITPVPLRALWRSWQQARKSIATYPGAD